MTKYRININQVANQSVSFDAGGYSFDMNLRTTDKGLFADMAIDGEDIFKGRRCVNNIPLILSKRLITGNIYFDDQYGIDDPFYESFNEKYLLIYDDEYII